MSLRRVRLSGRIEEHNPPDEARRCSCCGKPYAAVGAERSSLVEIEVRAHRRVIRRGRWRRTCGCASSPVEVSAPPVPRLFANTSYGTSVWSRALYERYACLRPLKRVGAWLGDQGLAVAAGTLADSVPRFVPLFEPLGEARRTRVRARRRTRQYVEHPGRVQRSKFGQIRVRSRDLVRNAGQGPEAVHAGVAHHEGRLKRRPVPPAVRCR